MYFDLDDNPGRPYMGLRDGIGDRCPICGASGECPDAVAVPMPYPPVDIVRADPTSNSTGGNDG